VARLTGSAVVELNRAIGVAEADWTEAGLALVERLDLGGYQYFHSTRADPLRGLGRIDEAHGVRMRGQGRAHRAGKPLPEAARRRNREITLQRS
jgi:predicted RNA polymerase sigma factor